MLVGKCRVMGKTEEPIRLLVVEDQLLFREGLKSLLKQHSDLQVIGEATTGAEAVNLAVTHAPDVILLDLNLPDIDGIEVCSRIKALVPVTRIVILTVNKDLPHLLRAMKAGACGYLTKDNPSEKVASTVRQVFHEGSSLEPLLADRLLAEFANPTHRKDDLYDAALASLSPREKEILKMVADGKPNKIIADELDISEHTVRNHISNIFQKLHVNNRTEATVIAIKKGLI
ncbi:response regulator transcription factor [bacterium]|nr:response regulator transcription factor [bacterium]